MSGDFVSDLCAGLFLTLHSSLCIFGRKVFADYNKKHNEKLLAQLQKNPLPTQIALCFFGTLLVCLGLIEGAFDGISVAKDGLWPTLFIISLGVLCLLWAKHVVFVQTLSLRMCFNPLTDWAGNVTMLLMDR